jgi:hypothetical protein
MKPTVTHACRTLPSLDAGSTRGTLALCLSVAAVAIGFSVALSGRASACCTPSHKQYAVRLSSGGNDRFINYDGQPNFDQHGRDWPIDLVFYNNASVNKVKDGLARFGYSGSGSTEHEGYTRNYNARNHGFRFDSDRGRKTACDVNHNDNHYRLYAPPSQDRLYDPTYGYYVVGSTHLDHNECTDHPTHFGFSERVEYAIGTKANTIWTVTRNHLALYNSEGYDRNGNPGVRRDMNEPSHYWMNDGNATIILLP